MKELQEFERYLAHPGKGLVGRLGPQYTGVGWLTHRGDGKAFVPTEGSLDQPSLSVINNLSGLKWSAEILACRHIKSTRA